MDACVLLQIRDPAEFYSMSPELQRLWIDYAARKRSGDWSRGASSAVTVKEGKKRTAGGGR